MSLSAVLFDLDDTLITSDHPKCMRESCASFEGALGRAPGELLRALLESREAYWSDFERATAGRRNIVESRRQIAELTLARFGISDAGLALRMALDLSDRIHANLALFPESLAVLAGVRALGLRCALVTNGTSAAQNAKIDRFGLRGFFDAIVIEQEFGVGKPDRTVYCHALRAVGATPGEALMIGDRLDWDVFPPMDLGLHGVWHNHRGGAKNPFAPREPDHVVEDIAGLLPIVSS